MYYKSDFDVKELISRWDDYTSFKNFAGGDDYLDNVYISRRFGRIVYLRQKPRYGHNLFGAAFWGILKKRKKGGSGIMGFFGLSILDTVILALFYALYGMVISRTAQRGNDDMVIEMCVIGVIGLFCVLFTFPKTREGFKSIFEKVCVWK